jgi:hypothetical protein
MTPEQNEILAKLAEIEDQLNNLLAESADVPGLARSRVLHARNLARYLKSVIGKATLTLIKSKDG